MKKLIMIAAGLMAMNSASAYECEATLAISNKMQNKPLEQLADNIKTGALNTYHFDAIEISKDLLSLSIHDRSNPQSIKVYATTFVPADGKNANVTLMLGNGQFATLECK